MLSTFVHQHNATYYFFQSDNLSVIIHSNQYCVFSETIKTQVVVLSVTVGSYLKLIIKIFLFICVVTSTFLLCCACYTPPGNLLW